MKKHVFTPWFRLGRWFQALWLARTDVTAYAETFGQSDAPIGRTVAGKKWANFTALYLFNKATNFDEFFFVGLEILWTFQNKKLEYNLTSQRWEVSVLVQTIRFFAEKWIHKNEAGSPETEWIQKILFLSERIHQSTRYKLQTAARIVKYGKFGTLF